MSPTEYLGAGFPHSPRTNARIADLSRRFELPTRGVVIERMRLTKVFDMEVTSQNSSFVTRVGHVSKCSSCNLAKQRDLVRSRIAFDRRQNTIDDALGCPLRPDRSIDLVIVLRHFALLPIRFPATFFWEALAQLSG